MADHRRTEEAQISRGSRPTGAFRNDANAENIPVGADLGQIVISNPSYTFLNSGDSGSLMVEDIATYPRSIGLLFAGNSIQPGLVDVSCTSSGAQTVGTLVKKNSLNLSNTDCSGTLGALVS